MRFGDVGANQPIPYRETYFQISYMGYPPVAANTAAFFNIATATMPFTGRVEVNAWARLSWINVPAVVYHSLTGSPLAPTYTSDNGVGDVVPNASFQQVVDLPTSGFWGNVAQGTVLVIQSRIWVGPHIPFVSYIGGFVRISR